MFPFEDEKKEKLSLISEQPLIWTLVSLLFFLCSGNIPIWRWEEFLEDEKKEKLRLVSTPPSFNLNICISSFFLSLEMFPFGGEEMKKKKKKNCLRLVNNPPLPPLLKHSSFVSLLSFLHSENVPIWWEEFLKDEEKEKLSSISEQPSPSFNLNTRLSSFFPLT